MTRYRLPPGANKVETDGNRFNEARGNTRTGGFVNVSDPKVEKAMEQAARVAGVIHKIGLGQVTTDTEKFCEPCNFTLWPWQQTCPRCGRDTVDKE